jgi:hypothetical protein
VFFEHAVKILLENISEFSAFEMKSLRDRVGNYFAQNRSTRPADKIIINVDPYFIIAADRRPWLFRTGRAACVAIYHR